MSLSYAEFLESKRARHEPAGRTCDPADVHPTLHGWQRDLVAWAVRTGRCALWEDTGLGKTFQQLEWARLVAAGGSALIVAPLAVCQQTIREAARIGVEVRYTPDGEIGSGLWITNYERALRVDATSLDAVVLDEELLAHRGQEPPRVGGGRTGPVQRGTSNRGGKREATH